MHTDDLNILNLFTLLDAWVDGFFCELEDQVTPYKIWDEIFKLLYVVVDRIYLRFIDSWWVPKSLFPGHRKDIPFGKSMLERSLTVLNGRSKKYKSCSVKTTVVTLKMWVDVAMVAFSFLAFLLLGGPKGGEKSNVLGFLFSCSFPAFPAPLESAKRNTKFEEKWRKRES